MGSLQNRAQRAIQVKGVRDAGLLTVGVTFTARRHRNVRSTKLRLVPMPYKSIVLPAGQTRLQGKTRPAGTAPPDRDGS